MNKKESPILGLDGKPIQRDVLKEEYARPSLVGVRQAWLTDSAANALHPRKLAAMLQAANEGNDYDLLTLAEEMEEREAHYGSVLGTRKRAVEGLGITVEAASDDARDVDIASAVTAETKRPEFEALISDLLDGLGKGRSSCEIMWETGKVWRAKEFIHRDPRYFKFNPEDPRELRLIDDADVYKGIPLPGYKFVNHFPKLKTGLPVRDGLARMVAVSYMCKSFTLKDWMAFSELFGMPIRVGRFGAGAKEDDIDVLRSAVANIGSDAAAIIPESMRIEFIERTSGASGGHQLFKELAEWLDKQISKAVLGQTATTEGTAGKLGGDDAQQEVRQDILKADAKAVALTINMGYIKAYVDLNYGVQEHYPKVVLFVPEPEDIDALVKALDKLVPLGLKVKTSQISDKLGLEEVQEGDEYLQIPTPSAGAAETVPGKVENNHSHTGCKSCGVSLNNESGGVGNGDEIDQLLADELEDWETMVEPMLDPVLALAEESQDEEEFLARLPELLESMEPTALMSALATATFKARGIGNAKD